LERKVASLASTRPESKGQSEFGDSFRVNLDPRAEWRLGYDPTIGIMHEGNDGSSKFIFDLMEPERPKVDRAVLDFVGSHVFDPADFVIRSDGVCRLNPEMARMVVARVST
jgi:CRISPR/Cas system-associated endonuclease Cas1